MLLLILASARRILTPSRLNNHNGFEFVIFSYSFSLALATCVFCLCTVLRIVHVLGIDIGIISTRSPS